MTTLTHTVQFNNDVTFTDHTGVSFVNTTTPETASVVTSATVSPSDTISYDVTWATDPAAGDVVEWRYDELGNYVDDDAVGMASQNLVLTNCLDSSFENVEWFAGDNLDWTTNDNLEWL